MTAAFDGNVFFFCSPTYSTMHYYKCLSTIQSRTETVSYPLITLLARFASFATAFASFATALAMWSMSRLATGDRDLTIITTANTPTANATHIIVLNARRDRSVRVIIVSHSPEIEILAVVSNRPSVVVAGRIRRSPLPSLLVVVRAHPSIARRARHAEECAPLPTSLVSSRAPVFPSQPPRRIGQI